MKKLKIKCTLRKRRTYGPNNASGVVWALFHFCGPSLAVVGCCGPSWACVGLCLLSLTAVGLHGPALAFVGRCQLLWAFLGLVVIIKIKIKCTLRKRRTYGPNDVSSVVWALFRLRGPLLAVVGCCWPSWVVLPRLA